MSKRYPGGLITKTPVVPTSLSAPGIWSLSDQAAAQATNTWPFPRDPQFNYVTMLLHGDGSGGPTSLGMGAGASPTVTNFNADASINNFNVTINGDAKSNNFTPYQAGYYSNYFDGTGDYLTVPDNAVLDMGSSDFTIEGWVFLSSTGSSQTFVAKGTGAGNQASYHIVFNGTNWLYYLSGNGSTWSIASGVTMGAGTANTWQHLALVRSGSTFTPYVNGTAGTTTSSATALFDSTNVFSIGADDATNQRITGYISNCRVVKGTAVYTSAFTPSTTPLTAITNTQLLTCQSNRFIDNSSNAFAITKNGDTAVSPAQPFTLPSSVATYGSGYFDGTGDYLTLPVNSAFDLGTNACCVESWVYLTNNNIFGIFTSSNSTSGSTRPNFYARFDQLQLDYFGTVVIQANITVTLNCWHHVVFTRAASSGAWRIFLDGVLKAYEATGSQNLLQTGAAQEVGRTYAGTTGQGYIGDVRIVNGAVPSAYVTSSTTVGATIFTPPTEPLTAITNTSLLTTQYNGGGNNSGFKDSSQFNFPITRNGNTTQGTFTPYGSNWSNYFDGDGDGLTSATSSGFAFGTGDFTYEAWYYSLDTGASQRGMFDTRANSSSTAGVLMREDSSGFLVYINGGTLFTASGRVANTWQHIALVRNSGTIRLYVNGVQANSAANTTNFTDTNCRISGFIDTQASPYGYFGYISNARVLKGTCLYPSGTTFTPPTAPLTAITNTSLLTCQSNRFVDNSASPLTLTVNGTPSVQRFSPFSPTTAYSTSVIGGSGYFDGNDYLQTPSGSCPVINNFSVSAWVYRTSAPAGQQTFVVLGYPLSAQIGFFWTGSNFEYNIYGSSTITIDSSGSMPVNAWTYVVLTRTGSSLTLYYNGVLKATVTLGTAFGSATGRSAQFMEGTYGYAANLRFDTAAYSSPTTVPTTFVTTTANTNTLLNFTNAGILDNAMMNNLETVGNAQISTSVKKYGTGSIALDGTGDYLQGPNNPNLQMGSGSFTIEMWLYTPSLPSAYKRVFGITAPTISAATDESVNFEITNTNKMGATCVVGSTYNSVTDTTDIPTNTWTHWAFVRNGSTLTLYRDGTSVSSTSISGTSNWSTTFNVYVGRWISSSARDYNGYIDDLRITKGVARYTANFTAPTQAFPNG